MPDPDGGLPASRTEGAARPDDADRHAGTRSGTEVAEESPSDVDVTTIRRRGGWRYYLRAVGPGLVTGASDDDPSGIGTYSQTGATLGFGLLWASIVTFPLMTAVQETCDRTALATGRSLGDLVRQRWAGRWVRAVVGALMVALVGANVLNIAADLVAVGAGMNLLHAGPIWVWALVAGVAVTALVVLGSFARIALVFKVLSVALLVYLPVAIMVHPPADELLTGLIPHLEWDPTYLLLLVAVLGTTISPYLFFWQSVHRIEELRKEKIGGKEPVSLPERSDRGAKRKLVASRLDVVTGMLFSNVVMFAIITTTATTVHPTGQTDLSSAADAASALQPVLGWWAPIVFALGFIGSGMLAIPVLAGAGAAGLAGLMGKRFGFSRSPRRAPLFYVLVGVGTLGGTALTLTGVDPVQLLVISAYINGLAAPPFLVLVMLISGHRPLMKEYTNGALARILGWGTAALMSAAAIISLVIR